MASYHTNGVTCNVFFFFKIPLVPNFTVYLFLNNISFYVSEFDIILLRINKSLTRLSIINIILNKCKL